MENKISNFFDGLYVKDGRLINSRPDGMMGIEKIAKMKKMVHKQEKEQMIADGILRAKMSTLFMDE